jgi:hypothetical protein
MTERAMNSAKKYLSKMRNNSEYALVLFEHILPVLPLDEELFNPKALTMTLFKDGREITVSIIDYLAALVDEGQTEPDYYMLQFHRYLKRKRKLHLPKTYILNRNFWG